MSRNKVTIRGDKKAAAHLRRVANDCEDVSEAWPKVGDYLSNKVNRQFVTEGREFGKPWKRLKPSYALWKRRHGFPSDILVQLGTMKRSFTSRPMDIEEYTPTTAKFGSNNQKALWHHNGTFRDNKRVLPARKILVVTREVREDIKEIVRREITESI